MKSYEELLAEVQALKAQLEKQSTYIQQKEDHISQQDKKIQHLENINGWYKEQLEKRRKEKFGSSSEKMSHDDYAQINLFNEVEAERNPLLAEPTMEEALVNQPQTEDIHYTRKKKKGNRKETFEDLPVEVIEYTLDESAQVCPSCNHALHQMTKEVRKELKIIPAQVSVVEHVTYSYACRHCENTDIQTPIIKAQSPKALIAKSFASPSALAHIANNKFTLGLPLYRQEQDFARQGVKLSRQTMSNWMIQAAKLLEPIAKEMKADLLTKEIIHADETTLEVLCEPGRDAEVKSYMWVYRSASCDDGIVLYDYQQGRSGKFAKNYLQGYNGYLVADGWQGYKQLEPEVTLCGCWAHARRYFFEAYSIRKKADSPEAKGLKLCDELFALEKRYREKDHLSGNALQEKRLIEHKAKAEEFFAWVDEQSQKTLPKSLLGKALEYAQNQKQYLLTFLSDSRIELTNNIAERAIKPFVIGRKNWLFCNTPSGAKSSAILYSIIETAKENNLNPGAYLTWVFKQMQIDRQSSPATFLPYGDQVPDYCKLKKRK